MVVQLIGYAVNTMKGMLVVEVIDGPSSTVCAIVNNWMETGLSTFKNGLKGLKSLVFYKEKL